MTDEEHHDIVEAVLALGDHIATRHPSVEEIAEGRRADTHLNAMGIIMDEIDGEYPDDEARYHRALSIINSLNAAGLAIVQRQPS